MADIEITGMKILIRDDKNQWHQIILGSEEKKLILSMMLNTFRDGLDTCPIELPDVAQRQRSVASKAK